MGMRVVLTFWLLWIMLSWTKVYKYLFEFLLTIFWGIYLGMELLAHKVVLCLIFWRIFILFSKETAIFYILPTYKGSSFSTSSPTLLFSRFFFVLFLIKTILKGVRWYFFVGSICISLMSNNVEHLFMCLLKHMYFFFREMSFQVLCPFLNWVACYCCWFQAFWNSTNAYHARTYLRQWEYKDEWDSGSCATYHGGPLCVGKCRWIAHSRQRVLNNMILPRQRGSRQVPIKRRWHWT